MAQAAAARTDDLSALCERMDGIASTLDAYDYLRSLAAAAGFRHFTALRFPLDGDQRLSRQLVLSSLPQSIIRDYDQHACASRALASARRSVRPFAWEPGQICPPHAAGNDNRGNRSMLERAGVVMGLNLPVWSWRGIGGMIMFGGDRDIPDVTETGRLHLIANCLFDRLIEIQAASAEPGIRLTVRERQCLAWTSAGKTSSEIAGILALSEHTVNQYITSSGQKLGTVNRTQTVAKAIRLRLID